MESTLATEGIQLDGQILSGEDRFGVWKTTGELDGWWSSPEPKGENISRTSADGDYDLPVDYEARYITLSGSLRARNHETQHAAINRFTALVRRRSLLQVDGHGDTQWANVVRAGAFKMEPRTGTYSVWQARVKAPDPCKYGRAQDFVRTNGDVIVYHGGNYDAYPSIVVRGTAANGYHINGPGGKQYKVSRALMPGVPHRIEFKDGLLRVDGMLVPNGSPRSDVWPVPPGEDITFTVNVTNGGTAEGTITVTDTYI